MPQFDPRFTITAKTAYALVRIEAAKQAIVYLPITPAVLTTLRETAKLFSTHYSTQIEGNRLTQEQVVKVLDDQHFPGRERDEKEILGYYAALENLEQIALQNASVTERHVQTLHALVMAGGKTNVKPTPYRDGQNVIRDSRTKRIVYMPPEAKDVPLLMRNLIKWISTSQREELPCPLRAAVVHYQFATIHPYFDGNGRTARLLTTLVLHLGGYDLKGIYSLEEYYARDLTSYYNALTVGPSHNYYMGRAESDITAWMEYFCNGVAESFENVRRRAQEAAVDNAPDTSHLLRSLEPRARKVLNLFRDADTINSHNIETLFHISQRTARNLLARWVEDGLLIVADPAKKTRKYRLADRYK